MSTQLIVRENEEETLALKSFEGIHGDQRKEEGGRKKRRGG